MRTTGVVFRNPWPKTTFADRGASSTASFSLPSSFTQKPRFGCEICRKSKNSPAQSWEGVDANELRKQLDLFSLGAMCVSGFIEFSPKHDPSSALKDERNGEIDGLVISEAFGGGGTKEEALVMVM